MALRATHPLAVGAVKRIIRLGSHFRPPGQQDELSLTYTSNQTSQAEKSFNGPWKALNETDPLIAQCVRFMDLEEECEILRIRDEEVAIPSAGQDLLHLQKWRRKFSKPDFHLKSINK